MVSASAREQIRRAREVVLALWLLGWALLIAPACAPAPNVSYIYDDNGRLIAVVDAVSNNAAIYNYDQVGNLTSIAQQAASTVSVLNFSPTCGPAGTSVTIWGMGFSTSSVVKFSGTQATITSATTTQIVTSVPNGASSGAGGITVDTATSTKQFTVGLCGAPTITSFTPITGGVSTQVTVSGTNFDPTATDDQVTLNGAMVSVVPPVTSGSLSFAVPSGVGSGRIAVTTGLGTAVRGDFFVTPPSGTTPWDPNSDPLELTPFASGRIQFGETKTLTFSKPESLGVQLFDASEGQAVSVRFSFDTAFLSSPWNLYLFNPANVLIAASGTSDFIDKQTLSAGTHALVLQQTNTQAPLFATVTLYNVPADPTASLHPQPAPGQTVQLTTTVPGENLKVFLIPSAGERVCFVRDETACSTLTVTPEMNPPASREYCGHLFVDTRTLADPATTYTLAEDFGGPGIGTLTYTAYDVPADSTTGTLPINQQPPVTVSLAPCQNATRTFNNPTQQDVTVHVENSGYYPNNHGCPVVQVSLATQPGCLQFIGCGTQPPSQCTLTNLPAGTYTLSINPNDADSGSMDIYLTAPTP